jgi:hypothetical protein
MRGKPMKSTLVVLLLLVAIVLCLSAVALGQYAITKDPGNPVMSGGGDGTWNKHVFNPCVIYNEDSSRYEMWFSAAANLINSGHPWQVGFATSHDGVNWAVYPDPVMSRAPGSWDDASISSHAVIRDGGLYKMWYGSWKGDTGGIGYATSPDGIHWTKYAGNPVFNQGTAAWEAGGPDVGTVIKDPVGMVVRTPYTMWYHGYNAALNVAKIGVAFSTNGTDWTRDTVHNPILDVGGAGAWDHESVSGPKVALIEGTGLGFCMWYSSSYDSGSGLATSHDGVTGWIKYGGNPVLRPSPGAWDASASNVGAVMVRGNTIHFWYDGWHSPASTYLIRIGHATSPLNGSRRLVPLNYATIQAAIDAASDNDTVLVSDGTYYENIRFKGKKIVVASTYLTTGDTSHISKTIIDGSHPKNPPGESVVIFVDNEDTTSILCGFTITGGTGTSYVTPNGDWWVVGGGVFCDSAGAKLVSNQIIRNRILAPSPSGGGVGAISFGSALPWLVLEGNRIADNCLEGSSTSTWACGGGADIGGMRFRIVNNVFERDTAASGSIGIGGGMEIFGTSVSGAFPEGLVQGNVFRNNLADGRRAGGDCAAVGGGVYCEWTGSILFFENTFNGNAALAQLQGWAEGGGICINDEGAVGPGMKLLRQNRFIGNIVQAQSYSERGGAIDLYRTLASVSGNLIAGNSAVGSSMGRGGGIRASRSSFHIENNIIVKNRSGNYGGGIGVQDLPVFGTEQVIVNNTIVGNKTAVGGGLDVYNTATVVAFNNILWGDTASVSPEINVTAGTPVVQYCDIQGGYGGTGNINGDPRFVTGDTLFNLQAASPCIGRGVDSMSVGTAMYYVPSWDFDWHTRPRPAGFNQHCDMGAQEEQVSLAIDNSVASNPIPLSFALDQNYPNPFNPATVIGYQVPIASMVRLVVCDLLGREVKVLLNEKKEPGRYEVSWDAAAFASGVYICRMNAGAFVESRKMLMLR